MEKIQSAAGGRKTAMEIPAGDKRLGGFLTLPEGTRKVIVFAHGSGSSRYSPRNNYVAEVLNKSGMGTLLVDLLSREEESEDALTGHLRFNIEFLAERLVSATTWLNQQLQGWNIKTGYFGASTGAAAALTAAAKQPGQVHALVSRGGRPDLAGDFLGKVEAPTLFIVGGDDTPVIEMNAGALKSLAAREKKLEIVPGASHLFEEPGKLEEVARLAEDWFKRYLSSEI